MPPANTPDVRTCKFGYPLSPAQNSSIPNRLPLVWEFEPTRHKGPLEVEIRLPVNIRSDECSTTPLGKLHNVVVVSFKVYVKRTPTVATMQELVAVHQFMDNLNLLRNLLSMHKEASSLERVWIIMNKLTPRLPRTGYHEDPFKENRPGLYLECKCGTLVHLGGITQWKYYWDRHFTAP